jgi:hypothetical protein
LIRFLIVAFHACITQLGSIASHLHRRGFLAVTAVVKVLPAFATLPLGIRLIRAAIAEAVKLVKVAVEGVAVVLTGIYDSSAVFQ